MRALRVAPPCQLALPFGDGLFPGGLFSDGPLPAEWWAALPEPQRAEVLALLARLIARGVLDDSAQDGIDGGSADGAAAGTVGQEVGGE